MPSEPSGTPEPLARLADVLAEAAGGVPPTPLEVAEVLWLARHMEPTVESPAPAVRPEPAPEERPTPPVRPAAPSMPSPAPPPERPRTPLHLPAPAPPLGPPATETFLDRHGLTACLSGGVHGRSPDLTRLMPHPDVLRRAVGRLGVSPERCVLIGSTVAEQSAAHAAGVRFVGHGAEQARRRFDTADLIVPGLRPILEAARSLGSDTPT